MSRKTLLAWLENGGLGIGCRKLDRACNSMLSAAHSADAEIESALHFHKLIQRHVLFIHESTVRAPLLTLLLPFCFFLGFDLFSRATLGPSWSARTESASHRSGRERCHVPSQQHATQGKRSSNLRIECLCGSPTIRSPLFHTIFF